MTLDHPRLGRWFLITILSCFVFFAPGGMADWLCLTSLFLVRWLTGQSLFLMRWPAGQSRFLALLIPILSLYLLTLLAAIA